jgi:hypothetical protein
MARGNRRMAAIAVVALTAVAGSASAAQAASWSVTKQTDPDGDPASFTFSYQGYQEPFDRDSPNQTPLEGEGASGTFTLTDGQTFTNPDVPNGVYVIQEQTPAGWKVLDITCDSGGDTVDVPEISIGEGRVDLQVSPSETKSCVFTNQKLPEAVTPPPVVETPPAEVVQPVVTPPAPRPVVQVAPRRVRSAAARLVGPKRCVSNRYSVAVTGGPVRSVSFWVNGKRVKTVTARTGQRRFRFNRALRTPVARVEARVNFASNASPATRRLRKTIRRCAPAAVRPQFTG